MGKAVYLVYQLREDKIARDFVYSSMGMVKTVGDHLDWENYKHIYTGALGPGKTSDMDTLHGIWDKLDNNTPEDYKGRLSNGDIIVLHENGARAYIINDEEGYSYVSRFLKAPYKYYSTQRPVDLGTYPKTKSGPVKFVNFEKREQVENSTFKAWGYLAYDAPLTANQISNYELRAASDNPDNIRVSPYQLEAQLEVIGKWEVSKCLSDMARITWFHNDFGVFVKKDWVMVETVADRFNDIVQTKSRDAAIRAEKEFDTQVQVVGHWEEMKGLPDNERFTWLKPSIQAFALREPAVYPEQLEARYIKARQELADGIRTKPAPKRIAEQLAEAEKQVVRGVDAPTKKRNKSHEDR
jgi:hypothetical protein